MSKTLTTSVAFQDPQGNVLAGGTIIFQLNMGAKLISNGEVVNVLKVPFTLNASGLMPAAQTIIANDELMPTGTMYVVTIFNSNGLLVRGPENWILSGVSPIDISTITSSSVPDPGLANPIIGNPSAPQTITGQSLTLSSTAPLIVNGSATFNGAVTFIGSINCTVLNGIRCISPTNPQGWAGADFGAQLNSAMTNIGGPGLVQVATGTYTQSTAVSIPAGVVVQLAAGVTINSSATVTLVQASGIVGPGAAGDADTVMQGTAIWKMASGANLSPMILMQGRQAFIQNMVIDGNKINNPTAGPLIKATYAVSGTAVTHMRITDSVVQASKCDGLALISSNNTNAEVAAFSTSHVMFLNNDCDGVYSLNTSDIQFENFTQVENNGLGAAPGGAFAPAFTTVNVAAGATNAVVTWVSGSKWTTDSSIVGRDITVNNINWRDGVSGTTPVHMTIGSVSSTTSLVLACGNANQAACPGALNGVTFRMGYGWENINGGGSRFQAGDVGGNQLSGIRLAGNTAQGGTTPDTEISITNCQFGNNFENDIQIDGWDITGAARSSFWEHIVANLFIDGSQKIVLNTYDAIYVQDSGGNYIGSNFGVNNQPAYRSFVRIHETTAGREIQQDVVSANSTQGQTWTSSAFFSDTTTPTAFNTNIDRALANPDGSNQYMSQLFGPYLKNNSSFWFSDNAAAIQRGFRMDASNNVLFYGHPTAKNFLFQANPGTTGFQINNSGPVFQAGVGWLAVEGAAPAANAGFDECYADSTAHALKCSYNGGSFFNVPLVGIANTWTAAQTHTGAAIIPDQTSGITGTTTNNNVNAGGVGEYVQSVLATGSSVTLATGVTSNVTSISLTAGDWDVTGAVDFTFGATTSYTNLIGSVSTTTGTIGGQDSKFDFETPAAVPTAGADSTFPLPVVRFSLSATTTVFLVAQATFTVSTLKAYGTVRARRVR